MKSLTTSLATINPNVQQPYEPSELDPGTQEAIESLQKNIDKKQKELDRLNNFQEYSSLRKLSYEKRQSLIKQAEYAIADWNEEIRQMTATRAENLEWKAKAVSGKDIEVDPVLAEAARRKERQQKARIRAAESKLKSEQTTAKAPEVKAPKVKEIWSTETSEGLHVLSNPMTPSFEWEGRQYENVEHAYQSNKSGQFDEATYKAWQRSSSSSPVKVRGKMGTKTDLLPSGLDWNVSYAQDLWEEMAKQNPEQLDLLLSTGDAELRHTKGKYPWGGERNEFGKLLMRIRDKNQGLTAEVKTESDTKYGPGAADPNDPAFKAVSEVEAKSNTPGFGRYAIYLIDPISELIEDGAIALAAKMGFPKVAQALMYLMYYEAANLVSGILDATPQAANQAALAQMDQSMILAAGIGMVDEEQYNAWREELNNATVENIQKAMEDAEQMGSRSPLSRGWMAFEEATGAKVSPWQWGWVQDIMGSVGNQMAKLGNHGY